MSHNTGRCREIDLWLTDCLKCYWCTVSGPPIALEPSRVPSAESVYKSSKGPATSKPSSGNSRPSSARRPPASGAATSSMKDAPDSKREPSSAMETQKRAPAIDAVELQSMMETINSLQEQLASKTKEAASAQEQLERTIRDNDGAAHA